MSELFPITCPDVFSGKISHGFFTREGGVSEGVFKSLNVTIYSGDVIDNVVQNRCRVRRHMRGKEIITLRQIHSSDCIYLKNVNDFDVSCEGDAIVTDVPEIVIAVMTADCAPILFEGQKPDGHPVIGAAHAGWGGAVRGICESTVGKMITLGAEPDSIKAVIGPCIGQESYEVGEDFKKPFLDHDSRAAEFFEMKAGKPHFDLESYVAFRLEGAGVRHITALHEDTYPQEERFFSYRRSTHRGEKEYGRQISAISILKT